MDNYIEQIAINKFRAVENWAQLQEIKKQLQSFGDEDLLIAITKILKFSQENFENANEQFWTAFKYPLRVFDIKKGETPNPNEFVSVFCEKSNSSLEAWFEMSYSSARQCFSMNGAYYNVDRYHRWTRLPILETEQENKP